MNVIPLTMPDGRPIPNHVLEYHGVQKPTGILEVIIEMPEMQEALPVTAPTPTPAPSPAIVPVVPERAAWNLINDPEVTSMGFVKSMEGIKPSFWLDSAILKAIVEKYDLDVYMILNKLGHNKYHTLLASDIYHLLYKKHTRRGYRVTAAITLIMIAIVIVAIVIVAVYG